MRYLIIFIIAACIWYACSFKDYIQVEKAYMTLIKKTNDAQYWQCDKETYYEKLDKSDTGFAIGTVEIYFKPK
jgi:hypothetical protein